MGFKPSLTADLFLSCHLFPLPVAAHLIFLFLVLLTPYCPLSLPLPLFRLYCCTHITNRFPCLASFFIRAQIIFLEQDAIRLFSLLKTFLVSPWSERSLFVLLTHKGLHCSASSLLLHSCLSSLPHLPCLVHAPFSRLSCVSTLKPLQAFPSTIPVLKLSYRSICFVELSILYSF